MGELERRRVKSTDKLVLAAGGLTLSILVRHLKSVTSSFLKHPTPLSNGLILALLEPDSLQGDGLMPPAIQTRQYPSMLGNDGPNASGHALVLLTRFQHEFGQKWSSI